MIPSLQRSGPSDVSWRRASVMTSMLCAIFSSNESRSTRNGSSTTHRGRLTPSTGEKRPGEACTLSNGPPGFLDAGGVGRVFVASRRPSYCAFASASDCQERQSAATPVGVAGGSAGGAELQWPLSRCVVGMRDELHRVGGHRSGDWEGVVSVGACVFVLGSGGAGGRGSGLVRDADYEQSVVSAHLRSAIPGIEDV